MTRSSSAQPFSGPGHHSPRDSCRRSHLTEKHAKKPVIVMKDPKDIKAFTMRVNDDGRTVAAMDVLAPGIGEIIGGSQREERLAVLDARMTEQATASASRGFRIGAAQYATLIAPYGL